MKLFEITSGAARHYDELPLILRTPSEGVDIRSGFIKTGSIRVASLDLVSLRGLPVHIKGYLGAQGNNIVTLNNFCTTVEMDVDLSDNRIKSLKNIHKHFVFIGETIILGLNPIKSHILGLVLIEGLNGIDYYSSDSNLEFRKASRIVEKYLKNNTSLKARKKNLYDCQSELIDGGLDEYAKL